MKLEELMVSLRTFEMNLEEEKGDQKSKGIALQVESHAEEMESVCDDDNDLVESIIKIIKRLCRSNGDGSRSKDPGSVSTGVPTPRRNTYTNDESFNAGSRNRFAGGNSSEFYVKNKGIQCRECEGFGHIQAECANVIKKKNQSLNATWSEDYSKEDEANFTAFASRTDNAGVEEAGGSSGVASGVSGSGKTLVYESSDDEELTEEALIQSYKLMYKKWNEVTKAYERLTGQIVQSNIEKNNLQKTISDLEVKLKESETSVTTLTAELESMKKSVKMLNSGSSKLDEILTVGRSDKTHFGLGYTGKSTDGTTVFVKGSTSDVKNDEDLKASVVTPARIPAVITSVRVGVATPGRISTASPGKKKEKRWIPICHYCNRR